MSFALALRHKPIGGAKGGFFKRLLIRLTAALTILLLLTTFYFWSNSSEIAKVFGVAPSNVLKSMVELKMSSSPYVQVAGKSDLILTDYSGGLSGLDRYMGHYGWKRWDQMGDAISYARGKKQMTVQFLTLTHFFKICKCEKELQ